LPPRLVLAASQNHVRTLNNISRQVEVKITSREFQRICNQKFDSGDEWSLSAGLPGHCGNGLPTSNLTQVKAYALYLPYFLGVRIREAER